MDSQGNPALLQKGDASQTPLFLIHDSSGGVFGYYKLKSLGRPVYAIHNPWFRNTTKWEGGTMLFVEKYTELIKSIVPKGDILVGGWSMGGQIGIDIARHLALQKRSKLQVVGLVLIDTLYPYWGPPGTEYADIPVDLMLGVCPPDMKQNILNCAEWSREDCVDWIRRNGRDSALEGIEAEEPPPAIRINATQYIPVASSKNGCVAMLDYLRHEKGGWDLFPHDFVTTSWDMSVHHFGFFDKKVIEETSNKVKRACELLVENYIP